MIDANFKHPICKGGKAFALTGRNCPTRDTQGAASLALGLALLAFQAVPVQIRNLNYKISSMPKIRTHNSPVPKRFCKVSV